MNKFRFLLPVLSILSLFLFLACAQINGKKWQDDTTPISYFEENQEFDDARKNYKEYCSGCHGGEMQAFVDRKWMHGTEAEDLFKSIKVGYPNGGMPSFDTTFTDKEIKELVDYILTGIEYQRQYAFQEEEVKTDTFKLEDLTVELDTIVYDKEGLDIPWGMAFLPSGDMLVTDRGGKFFRMDKGGKLHEIANAPKVKAQGQGGLLDVELHPKYEENGWLFLSFSKPQGAKATTAVIRAKLQNDALVDVEEVFEGKPYWGTTYHFGSRIVFDNDGYMYISMGDRGKRDINPQGLDKHGGKIHRLNDDGSIPSDNPFIGQENVVPSIWSYGHRNPQGLAYNPETNTLWENEHGPRGGDEINMIRPGLNFGWPIISYGINYNGTTFTTLTAKDGMEQPESHWTPSIGVCGMAVITSDKYPGWKGDLMSGSLRFNYVSRSVVKDNKVVKEEIILKNIGRVRSVVMGRDGYMYVGVENPGAIYRIMPVLN
ncbi:MAG: PQQ-dependent sugar dehydrogenase [Bacteroidota bacterium]